MKPRIRLAPVLASALLVAATAAAQSAPSQSTPPMHFGGFGRCLGHLNLAQGQQDAIQQFLAAEKPTLQTLQGQIKADSQTLKTDSTAATPSSATVGADYLKVTADRQALAAERQKILDFISGQLNQDQKMAFQACFEGRFHGHRGSW
jgi:Spy/CpxP family protein refolding chaperone